MCCCPTLVHCLCHQPAALSICALPHVGLLVACLITTGRCRTLSALLPFMSSFAQTPCMICLSSTPVLCSQHCYACDIHTSNSQSLFCCIRVWVCLCELHVARRCACLPDSCPAQWCTFRLLPSRAMLRVCQPYAVMHIMCVGGFYVCKFMRVFVHEAFGVTACLGQRTSTNATCEMFWWLHASACFVRTARWWSQPLLQGLCKMWGTTSCCCAVLCCVSASW